MFDPESRYQSLETASITTLDSSGQSQMCSYKRRRFLPSPMQQQVVVEHQVNQGDRLDNLAAQYLGDPTQFWRLCDANLVSEPEELLATPGRRFLVSLRQA